MPVAAASASSQAIDDATLVAAAKASLPAFAPLYVRYFDRVHAYALRRLGHAEDAADATSLVFSRALAGIGGCREESFRSWLFAIAHNTLIEVGKGRRAQQELDEASEIPDLAPSLEDQALARESRELATRLLDTLLPEQRHVLELRMAGLTSKEIGAVLGKSPNAIDQAQFRAVTRLRQIAREQYPAGEVVP
jgi:RNA polymerase sigma-70 factor (ECF subfamily)